MKHTPGPWTTKQWKGKVEIWSNNFSIRKCICKIANRESEANARLISAAPELLEACKVVVNWSEKATPTRLIQELEQVILKIRQAVAKAEGRE